ncbi:short-chain dehydrogenase [Platysternon megacephalum]|uniref:Short-chain dehydrogenase n=1 Tax=Platysternon megacephalum TaxID=55544 RepID=A0A4D9DCJ2_9SAUR|nr:short-chain dehydrogenase [Platysternon megacephalum]
MLCSPLRLRATLAALLLPVLLCAAAPAAASTDGAASQPRIIGGVPSPSAAYPWIAKLSVATPAGTYLCGATLVSPTRLLTAQHCLEGATKVTAYIGKATWTAGVMRTSTSFVRGPGVKKGDWAVIKLSTAVKATPVKLNGAAKLDDTATFRALGWGVTATGGASAVLQEVDLPRQKPGTFDCATTTAELCAGVPTGGKDTCQGDSGGPLLAKNGKSWVQVGITSWGKGCAQAGNLGHYTRVSTYLKAIQAAIAGA